MAGYLLYGPYSAKSRKGLFKCFGKKDCLTDRVVAEHKIKKAIPFSEYCLFSFRMEDRFHYHLLSLGVYFH